MAATSIKRPTNKTSKKAQAIALCKRLERRKNVPAPKVFKSEMVEKIGMTKAQAATYYHKARKGGEWRKEV